ncbi:MAG: hypothetical protein ACRCX2_15555 [Paraclostridium sp.]
MSKILDALKEFVLNNDIEETYNYIRINGNCKRYDCKKCFLEKAKPLCGVNGCGALLRGCKEPVSYDGARDLIIKMKEFKEESMNNIEFKF